MGLIQIDENHENHRMLGIECRAYRDMDEHAPRWIEWLAERCADDPFDIVHYVSNALAAHVVNADQREDAIIARGEQADIGQRLRADYIAHCVAQEDDA